MFGSRYDWRMPLLEACPGTKTRTCCRSTNPPRPLTSPKCSSRTAHHPDAGHPGIPKASRPLRRVYLLPGLRHGVPRTRYPGSHHLIQIKRAIQSSRGTKHAKHLCWQRPGKCVVTETENRPLHTPCRIYDLCRCRVAPCAVRYAAQYSASYGARKDRSPQQVAARGASVSSGKLLETKHTRVCPQR